LCSQLVRKFPIFYGTRTFITLFPRAHHWSLSSAKWIQSTPSYYPFCFLSCSKMIQSDLRSCVIFCNKLVFMVKSCSPFLIQPPSWRTNHYWLSMTAYSVYIYLSSIAWRNTNFKRKPTIIWWSGYFCVTR
jgi:hypothetical protein